MRIWSVHPKYLDVKGLVALWREGLLAQNVLLGKTKGYKNHPQLDRFKNSVNKIKMISNYLHEVCNEADSRGYNFNRSKIANTRSDIDKIKVKLGQINYEWKHLLLKVKVRDTGLFNKIQNIKNIESHPLFEIVDGDVEEWERVRSK